VADAGRIEAELRTASGRAEHDLAVEETVWGATHAVLVLATGSPDAARITELLAAMTAGSATPRSAGRRVVELPV
jgi:protein of hypothetical function UPF0029